MNGELLNWRFMFGYSIRKGEIRIKPEEADIVRDVFRRATSGESFSAISRELNSRGISGALGGHWNAQRIRDMLGNEKYAGDALLQKHFRNNHLEKKKCRNTGELPRYYAKSVHPAIIDQETFQQAQEILSNLKKDASRRARQKKSEFSGLIRCPRCGKNYKRVTGQTTIGWNCSTYQTMGKRFCRGKAIPETTLRAVCASVLGMDTYDPDVLRERIACIEVPEDNRLRFIFKDGHVEERAWADRSRADSWTTEMKEAARQREMNQRRAKSCQP